MGTITRNACIILSSFFCIGFVALALITILPADASKPNLLGYYGVCSWALNSSAILVFIAGISLIMVLKFRSK
jgi:hypothetical protein